MLQKLYIYQHEKQNEICFYILFKKDICYLENIKEILSSQNTFEISESPTILIGKEIGPRSNFKTSWCNTMLDIFERCGINEIETIEYSLKFRNCIEVPNYDKMLYTLYYQNYFIKNFIKDDVNDNINYVSIDEYNQTEKLGFDSQDLKNYKKLFCEVGRYPTNVELYDLSQCNSEHARHWYFKGIIGNEEESLFQRIKSCYNEEKHRKSLVSFYDNASVIIGSYCNDVFLDSNRKYNNKIVKKHFSYKAETHNFPTGVSPFPGAATGAGGRIRDILCVGLGGDIIGGTAGYCVGDIFNQSKSDYSFLYNNPIDILIEASNGASDYGNKIGEPLIQGFTRSYRQTFENNDRIEWLKPIMFSGGIGNIYQDNINKKQPEDNDLIIRIGGPAYRIGMGGGTASSRTQDNENSDSDFDAVQRGDPLVANKLVHFLRQAINLKLILSIHDQGSGGMANVTREICEDKGAKVYLSEILLGDKTLTSLEKWVAEYQEQITFLTKKESLNSLYEIAERENLSLVEVGTVNNSGKLQVYTDKSEENIVIDLPIEQKFNPKTFSIRDSDIRHDLDFKNLPNFADYTLFYILEKVFSLVDVGSKQFLTNKVDRSVSGLIVQQQCIGPFHLPLSNLAAVKNCLSSDTMLVSAIGEQPIKGVCGDIENMVSITVGEMLTNMIWCNIVSISNINSVANWMWASTNEEDGGLLNKAVNTLVRYSKHLGFSINGGKDSLSMKVKNNFTEIKAPNTLVLSGYTSINSKNKIITPNLSGPNNLIYLVRLEDFGGSLGGSAFSRVFKCKNTRVPYFRSLDKFKNIFNIIQNLISEGIILCGHDISDGGLLTTLSEMSFSSLFGLNIDIKSSFLQEEYFFSEELGLVFEVNKKRQMYVEKLFADKEVKIEKIGNTISEREILIKYNGKIVLDEKNDDVRYEWEKTSYMLEMKQAKKICIEEEIKNCFQLGDPNYIIPNQVYSNLTYYLKPYFNNLFNKPRVAILRSIGSNGDREMAHCFMEVGFDVFDVTINDIELGKINLKKFRGIAFVGGFSYGDVLGSAYGWYYSIKYNKIVKNELDKFYQRNDTFSLGICNGCQLMSLLEWIPKGISLEENISERFESRWSKVRVVKNNNIFLQGLEGLVFGIYTAHGEGRIESENELADEIFPVRYADQDNNVTHKYPFNPNGSPDGRAAVSSECGRHLAIMPHPERTIYGWQLPIQFESKYSPWFIIFKNVYDWCCQDYE